MNLVDGYRKHLHKVVSAKGAVPVTGARHEEERRKTSQFIFFCLFFFYYLTPLFLVDVKLITIEEHCGPMENSFQKGSI